MLESRRGGGANRGAKGAALGRGNGSNTTMPCGYFSKKEARWRVAKNNKRLTGKAMFHPTDPQVVATRLAAAAGGETRAVGDRGMLI